MTGDNARRTVTANITLSLDGRVSGPGGEYDMSWIAPHAITPKSRDHMVSVTGAATTALLGRKNYEGFAGFWPAVADDEGADPRDREFSRWLNAVEKVVFSTTLKGAAWDNARIADSDPVTTVKQLREQEGGDIIILASASVIRSLLQAGEVDRLSITLCPELVGGGARLFTDGPSASWALTSSEVTESGAICLLYDRVGD
ncbi:dihydrofolate reductase family protein [Actinoallomurus iriomotensis]|uniref:Riboflavin biosynthesis protein RibD n=1 Tax=Actinoallomurus iriomotensis TaxID=478107 RepID=A0A9W6RFS1_9ACTN|nr:dihydrofolate reductase family protein [Actinoallomurus iriomotensis]GLY74943.1 riboflavin biosynthesis protein RibD [Actinoallomurus iriomotensis]